MNLLIIQIFNKQHNYSSIKTKTMIVKFKKLDSEVEIPSMPTKGNVGIDLKIAYLIHTPNYIECGFGLSVEIPEGYFGMLVPRSSITQYNLMLKNSVGIIDSSYRGELKARFTITGDKQELHYNGAQLYNVGDKAIQLIILPYIQFEIEEAFDLSESERGEGAFGSTGA